MAVAAQRDRLDARTGRYGQDAGRAIHRARRERYTVGAARATVQ